ncbi:PREDICTED: zinc finger and SCAN domain-containing protein 16-like [Amphimedon queenslandica]|uniref:SCAN box domain-containing protein n=1 Tax=Amphimedon queenslandica TaxID=400682 RepID=A0AAN0IPQ6_AMPQE|nr:PREDICTED: zinc finger and SCAN domain-containing protein 16-like [Amphimedon queenslandica]|eukprot:XP_011405989.1 PREDICTED: zinc finger and SCAN domain-containing protein 16-like [Amphimedon queenslandica]
MLTQITDLADKWLESCTTREEVIDCVILQQFVNVLPEEARTWVKERKPSASKEAVSYPVAVVEIDVGGKLLQVEATVSDTLPRSVLLGTNVPELNSLLREERGESGLAVLTRSGARRQKKEEEELQRKEKESGAKTTTVEVDAQELNTGTHPSHR